MNDLVSIFKTLADETRLRIIMLLHFDELCVCEISGILDVPQPTVSKGLAKLRDLDLVVNTRNDKFVHYKLHEDNGLLTTVLTAIEKEIEMYPQLLLDKQNISNKLNYSNPAACFISEKGGII